MVAATLNDSRYSEIPLIQATLVAKRKSVGVYRGRLCARGYSIPLNHTSFSAIPAAHRCGVKQICTVAAIFGFPINAVGASQAFLQSDNFDEPDRCIIIHQLTIHLPLAGKLYPPGTYLRFLPKSTRGFLIPNPLYGNRESPLSWLTGLSEVLNRAGLRQMMSDICMYLDRCVDRPCGRFIVRRNK